jgi:hypothetical protein
MHCDRSGELEVRYRPLRNPVDAGFDAIPNLSFDIGLAIGYPEMTAKIIKYAGSGARTLFGWIQIVTNERISKTLPVGSKATTTTICDILPSMMGARIPFMFFGEMPQVYDAPCRNLGDSAELKWYADTFLTNVLIRSQNEPINCLAAFRWGYNEDETPRPQPIELLPLTVEGQETWRMQVPFLKKEYPDWYFDVSTL